MCDQKPVEYSAPLDYTEAHPFTLLMKSLQGPEYCNKIITVKRYESQGMSLGIESHTSQASLAFFILFYCILRQQDDEVTDNDHITVWQLKSILRGKNHKLVKKHPSISFYFINKKIE